VTEHEPIDPPALAGYRFLERLATGGFSEVFLYERDFPRQKVAIKVLVPHSLGDASIARFTSEANVMASLSTHPYIVTIYQADVSPEGHPYLVMEYYPKPNFGIRARTERFSVASVLRAGTQIAAAVETAHRSGVLHRDIKPANILTSEYLRPGLTDFGIAVVDADPADEAEGMSIPWSPPEVVSGDGRSDERADVYSLAATLYTLLAGRSPFELHGVPNRRLELIDRIERMPPPPIERADVPGSLQRLLAQCMSKEPDGRPSSAAELARSLQAIEVEQRFDMTPFEVSEGQDGAGASQALDVEAGSTQLRAPAVIEAQSDSAPGPRSVPPGPGDAITRTPYVARPRTEAPRVPLIHATPYVPEAPTPTASPASMATSSSEAAAGNYSTRAVPTKDVELPAAATQGERKWFVLGGVIAAVLLASIAAIVFWPNDGDGEGGVTSTTIASPGPVTVTPVPEAADQYQVVWTPVGGLGVGGSYLIEWGKEKETVDGSTNRLPISAEPGVTPCVRVRAVPAEGLPSEPAEFGCD
jgi:serine/threonine protein kinase